jgi:hypothetical protein
VFRNVAATLGTGLLATALAFTPNLSSADGSLDDFGDADFGSEFDELDATVPESELEEVGQKFVDITGTVGFETIYNYDSRAPQIGDADWRGFAQARFFGRIQNDFNLPNEWKARLSATAFYDTIYGLRGRSDYSDDVIRDLETDSDIEDAYLQGSLTSKIDLKTGRQVVNWGYADSFRVLDILNPLDSREPGLVDIEDLRLPVTMTVLETFLGDWTVSGIAVHEWREPDLPPEGSAFFPEFGASDIPENDPNRWDPFNETALSLLGTVKGVDLSFRYARVYEDTPHLEIHFLDGFTPTPIFDYTKYNMFGMGAQGTKGSWLFKAETAYRDKFVYDTMGDDEVGRVDMLFGAEYYGFPNNQTISIELLHQHHHNWDRAYFDFPNVKQRNNTHGALRYTSNYLNERLELTALAILFTQWDDDSWERDSAMYRLSLDYEVTDNINWISTLVIYQGGEDPFLDTWRNNDRVAMRLEYNF